MAIPILPLLSILAVLATYGHADCVLYNGEVLMAGQNLTNGPYRLAMQPNCDLVVYRHGKPTWKANINGKGKNCYLGLKQTGELVVRRDIHYTLWSSTTRSKKGKYALVLDGNGRLNIYGNKRWTSNNQKEAARPQLSMVPVETEYVMYSGHRLAVGSKLVYRDYELAFNRCNLVINNTRTGRILWQTNTKSNGCYLQLEYNGELALKHASQKIWSSSRKWDNGMYAAMLRFDGRLAIYGPLLWSSNKTHQVSSGYHVPNQVQMELSSLLWG